MSILYVRKSTSTPPLTYLVKESEPTIVFLDDGTTCRITIRRHDRGKSAIGDIDFTSRVDRDLMDSNEFYLAPGETKPLGEGCDLVHNSEPIAGISFRVDGRRR